MPRRHFRRNGPNAHSARLKFLYLRLVWRKLRLKRLTACNNFASHNADIVTNIYDKNNAELVTQVTAIEKEMFSPELSQVARI